MADEKIEGLPEGAEVKPLQQSASSGIEGLPEGAEVQPVQGASSSIEGLPEGATVSDTEQSSPAPAQSMDYHVTNPLRSEPDPKGYGDDHWYQERIGKLVPEWAMKPLGAANKYFSHPLGVANEFAEEHLAKAGESVGKLPAQALTVAQHPSMLGTIKPGGTADEALSEIDKRAANEHPYVYGAGAATGQLAGTMLSPQNLAMLVAMPEAEAYPLVSKVVSAAFATQMGAGAMAQAKNLIANWPAMTSAQRAQGLTALLEQGAMTAAAATHAVKGKGPAYSDKTKGVETANESAARLGKIKGTEVPPAKPAVVKPGPYGEAPVTSGVPEGVETAQETAARKPDNLPLVTKSMEKPGPYGEIRTPEVPPGIETAQETAARRPDNLPPAKEVPKLGPYGEAPTEAPLPKGAEALGRIGTPEAEPAAQSGEALATKAPVVKSGELGTIKTPDAEPASKTGEALGTIKTNREIGPEAVKESEAAVGAKPVEKPAEAPKTEAKPVEIPHANVADWHNKFQGFSFNPERGFIRDEPVYSVGGEYPDLVKVIKGRKITDADVQEFADRPDVQKALAADKRNNLGGWNYKGNAHLEISKMLDNRDEAIAEGKRLNQDSIYDHATRETIPTGGTAAAEEAAKAGVTTTEEKPEKAPKTEAKAESKGSVPAALKEIESSFEVNPNKPGAGTVPKEFVTKGRAGEPEASFTVSENNGRLRLKGIEALQSKTGAGSRALKTLTDIADKHGIKMELTASPYGDEKTRLDSDQLKSWYERNGFVQEPGTDPAYGYMVREPKAEVEEPVDRGEYENAAEAHAAEKDEREAAAAKEGTKFPGKPKEGDLTEEQQRGLEHRLGQDIASKLSKTPEGIAKAQRLVKGTNQQFADLANEHGPFKSGDVNTDWTADDFKRSRSKDGSGLSANKSKVIQHIIKNEPHDEFMEATKGWGPKSLEQKFEGKGPAPEATPETAKMSEEELLKRGFTKEDIEAGKHLQPVGGGASAATALAEEKGIPEAISRHMTPEEIASVSKSSRGTASFVAKAADIPEVQEYIDIALAGEGAKKWYQRSAAAFDAMADELPEQFREPGDKEKFIGLLAATSPQQTVAMNMREALATWKAWDEAGRPTGDDLHFLLKDAIKSVPDTKIPNAILALEGKDMWPDLSKNRNFKVGSFVDNLKKWLDGVHYNAKGRVTNDSWMALFGGVSEKAISLPSSYHPLSVATRAAAEHLGWEPEEAQAAIWSFTQALTEAGEERPEAIRDYSEDFADLMGYDPQVRGLLQDLGVNLDQLDARLAKVEAKPEITGRTTATTDRSIGKLKGRIEEARGRGRGAIPPSKSAQGSFGFREGPAHEGRARNEDVSFNTEELEEKPKPESGKIQYGEDGRTTILVEPDGTLHSKKGYSTSEGSGHSSLALDKGLGSVSELTAKGGIRAFTLGPEEAEIEVGSSPKAIRNALKLADKLGRERTTLQITNPKTYATVFAKKGTYEQLRNMVNKWEDEESSKE